MFFDKSSKIKFIAVFGTKFMLKIKAFIETSFLDWDGKISSVLFLPGCNLKCVYCHNYKLVVSPDEIPDISWDKIKKEIISRKKWIDGICITGGEPCLHEDIEELINSIKKEEFQIKLDTNGCFPEKLKKLINKKIIDYAALDIKAPLAQNKYAQITGVNDIDINKILESIEILHKSNIKYEFRTTVVPGLIGKDEIIDIINMININDKYVLQNFKPDNAYSSELRKIKSYSKEEMVNFNKLCKKYIKNSMLR